MFVGRLASPVMPELPLSADVDNLLDLVVDLTKQILDAEKCSLMFLLEEAEELTIRKARGLDEDIVNQARVKLGDGVAGWVAQNRKSVLAEGAHSMPSLRRPYSGNYLTESFISTPVFADDAVGVLSVADRHDGSPFTNVDLLHLQHMATMAGGLLSLQRKAEVMQAAGFTDPLTGLGNRRYFEKCLSQELARAQRNGQEVSLLVMDVDRFRAVNDICGHAGGDRVLQNIGRCIEQSIRRSDIAVRYGGDEFAIILSGSGDATAESVADRLVDSLAHRSVPEIFNYQITLSFSVGISSYPSLAVDEDQLIHQSHAVLYEAKKSATQRIQTWRSAKDYVLEAQQFGIPYLAAPADNLTVEIARLIPLDLARRHFCVPVGYERGNLTVAVVDPTDKELLKTLASVTHLTIHPVSSSPVEIIAALNRMAELMGKHSSASIAIRKIPHRGHELEIAVDILVYASADHQATILRIVRLEISASSAETNAQWCPCDQHNPDHPSIDAHATSMRQRFFLRLAQFSRTVN